MTKFIVPALSLLALATPVMATTSEPVTFTSGGEKYRYVVTETKHARLIEGVVLSTNEPFSLVVEDGQVTGDFDGHEVAFKTKDVVRADKLAAR